MKIDKQWQHPREHKHKTKKWKHFSSEIIFIFNATLFLVVKCPVNCDLGVSNFAHAFDQYIEGKSGELTQSASRMCTWIGSISYPNMACSPHNRLPNWITQNIHSSPLLINYQSVITACSPFPSFLSNLPLKCNKAQGHFADRKVTVFTSAVSRQVDAPEKITSVFDICS